LFDGRQYSLFGIAKPSIPRKAGLLECLEPRVWHQLAFFLWAVMDHLIADEVRPAGHALIARGAQKLATSVSLLRH
jgi:hypothetical protein